MASLPPFWSPNPFPFPAGAAAGDFDLDLSLPFLSLPFLPFLPLYTNPISIGTVVWHAAIACRVESTDCTSFRTASQVNSRPACNTRCPWICKSCRPFCMMAIFSFSLITSPDWFSYLFTLNSNSAMPASICSAGNW